MTDPEVAAKMQAIARDVKKHLNGRAFFVMVWPSDAGEKAHYVGNASREDARAGMMDFIQRDAPINLPPRDPLN